MLLTDKTVSTSCIGPACTCIKMDQNIEKKIFAIRMCSNTFVCALLCHMHFSYIDKMTMYFSRQSVGYSKEMLAIVKERN